MPKEAAGAIEAASCDKLLKTAIIPKKKSKKAGLIYFIIVEIACFDFEYMLLLHA
jgi:hypothetical protein